MNHGKLFVFQIFIFFSLQSFFSYPPEGMGFGPFGLGGGRGTFCDTFKCYSMVFFSNAKEDADHGGKSKKYFKK